MQRGKQGGIKFHFLSLRYETNRDWTPVSRTIVKHSEHYANVYSITKRDLNKTSAIFIDNERKITDSDENSGFFLINSSLLL